MWNYAFQVPEQKKLRYIVHTDCKNEADYPTPLGTVHVRHERQSDGSVKTEVTAPAGVAYTIIKEEAE